MTRLISEIISMDLLSILANTTVLEYTAINRSVYEILNDLLEFQTVEQKITLGHVADEFRHSIRSLDIHGDTILRAIHRLQETIGGYFMVGTDRRFHWFSSIGENKGQQIRYKKNMRGINRNIDYTQLYNRIYVFGSGGGFAALRLSDHPGYEEDYLEDLESQEQWEGIYSGVFVDSSISNLDDLIARAEHLLEEHKNPPISYQIETLDYSLVSCSFEKIRIGSIVRIIDEELNIDIPARVIAITYDDLILNPQNMMVELSTKWRDITDAVSDLYDFRHLESLKGTETNANNVIIKGETRLIDWTTKGYGTVEGTMITPRSIHAEQLTDSEALITHQDQIKNDTILAEKIKNVYASCISGLITSDQIDSLLWNKVSNVEITDDHIKSVSADKISTGTIVGSIKIRNGYSFSTENEQVVLRWDGISVRQPARFSIASSAGGTVGTFGVDSDNTSGCISMNKNFNIYSMGGEICLEAPTNQIRLNSFNMSFVATHNIHVLSHARTTIEADELLFLRAGMGQTIWNLSDCAVDGNLDVIKDAIIGKDLDVGGGLYVSGTKSAVVKTPTYGKVPMYTVEAPTNRFVDIIEKQFDKTGEHWIDIPKVFAETIGEYIVFVGTQGDARIVVLDHEPTRFKVQYSGSIGQTAGFMIYGKRIGYERYDSNNTEPPRKECINHVLGRPAQ